MSSKLLLGLLLILSGCGGLPQPFFGNPGSAGARLAAPPPSRLAVPTPARSLLSTAGGALWAEQLAADLSDRALPAAHRPAARGDWSLALSETMQDGEVVPRYAVVDSAGAEQGVEQGRPVPVETWTSNDPAILRAAADQAAPAIESLLSRLAAARLHDDPDSLQNRPARIYVAGVSGAPGDGDRSLVVQIKAKLAKLGMLIEDSRAGADYVIRCEVQTAPAPGGELRLELHWVVDDAQGERGRVVQLNDIPANTVSSYWGDVAVVAAEQAAGGIKEVLFNAAGPRIAPTAAK